jgi:hypothetical protein
MVGCSGKALKYEDPFNNPLVGGKAGGENSFVRMCGKLFRLAPVTGVSRLIGGSDLLFF